MINHPHKLLNLLASEDLPCWLLYSDEGSDQYFKKLITDDTILPAFAILTQKSATLIVSELEFANFERAHGWKIVAYTSSNSLWAVLAQLLAETGYPDAIALNYSARADAQVDTLGHGLFQKITREVHKQYNTASRVIRFVPADSLIYGYFERKTIPELRKLRIAARRAVDLLNAAFFKLRPGMSERQVWALVQSLMKVKPKYFSAERVISEECAWAPSLCPIVLTGPNLTKGGHTGASDTVIRRGYTVYFDFGVTLKFSDGSKWSSDVQRMGYVLRKGEKEAPANIQKVFDTLHKAVTAGIEAVRPGKKGYEIDSVVRKVITSEGFPEYPHSTGHAIGELPHNPGALLGSAERSLSHLRLQLHGVYTIEPRIAIRNGGSIEEMVHVSDTGGEALSQRQNCLYLVQ